MIRLNYDSVIRQISLSIAVVALAISLGNCQDGSASAKSTAQAKDDTKKAYWAYTLGQDCSKAQIAWFDRSRLPADRRDEADSEARRWLDKAQWKANYLKISIKLDSSLETVDPSTSDMKGKNKLFNDVEDRILVFHDEKVAASFNVGKDIAWILSKDKIRPPNSRDLMGEYAKRVTTINSNLKVMGFSKTVTASPTDSKDVEKKITQLKNELSKSLKK